ncbi:MAG: methionine--tRNA ligase [Acidobacteria bacterium]|nr:methionine--tRNA ligase [Acidobacteriota bacterium]MXZ39254.1 methionine--tRNA ligase [Holophagales bacterium]MYF04596.1 methionine--tRNA ligase [Holophagales bacterium]MYJ27038.1 methionine--tRNA ligase [Holophagales bacterium]
MPERRRILVTNALPYANGPIHLGHMVEAVQTDIWCRLQRMRGRECYNVCAEDAHGTPIMLRAEREGITPEELIGRLAEEHLEDYRAFSIHFDDYYTTHSPENRQLVEEIYGRLRDRGSIDRRTVRQFYDPERGMFLPDRFIKGTCPRCGAKDQNGDSCDECGSTYQPSDLIDPRSIVTGALPVEKESEHLFLRLSDYGDLLEDWVGDGRLQSEVVNKLQEWFDDGLRDWDISRDAPYFGFEIPDAPNKYFYVWVDAPIGYMAAFRRFCDRNGVGFGDFWGPDSDAELYHFIGKDILYFHCLFWPAMLHGGGYRTPSSVFVHGFLTVDGAKMSKSRGTFVMARTYLEHLDPEAFRYYIAAKLSNGLADIDLNLEDFVLRVNSDLVGKVVNIASRCAGFLHRQFDGRLAAALDAPELAAAAAAEAEEIADLYEGRDYNRALRRVIALADRANRYIDDRRPWEAARDPERAAEVQAVCTTGLELFRQLVVFLKPVVPAIAGRAETFLRTGPLVWDDVHAPLLDREIGPFEPLLTRVRPEQVAAMIAASGEDGPG